MTASDGHYIHGTERDEQKRLALLNELLNERSLHALRLGSGERVLDVGSGPGQLSCAMAETVGDDGFVVGVERDSTQLAEARLLAGITSVEERVDFRAGDAAQLPLTKDEWGTFDVAHARFLLEHVPDPRAVVGGMVHAVRPGGRVILEDDDHDILRFWPDLPEVTRLWRAYIECYDRVGNDPFVGRKLVAILKAAGAEPVRNDFEFFGSCAGDPNFQGFVGNFLGVLDGARDSILAFTSVEADELDRGLQMFRDWGAQTDAALWYATCWAEGRRPSK